MNLHYIGVRQGPFKTFYKERFECLINISVKNLRLIVYDEYYTVVSPKSLLSFWNIGFLIILFCRTQLRRFRLYNLLGWGLPFTITIVTLVLQYLPTTYTNHLVMPGIGNISPTTEPTHHHLVVPGIGYISPAVPAHHLHQPYCSARHR